MLFAGKTVVITGAGSGLGRGLAAGFCGDGANVIGIGRTAATLEETAERFGQGRMHCVVGDVTVGEDVERLFAEAAERFDAVDVLINNAAVYPKRAFLDDSMDEWAQALATNVAGVARCCHRALPGMLERGYGRIINIGSMAWKKPIPQSSVYSASKGALRALTRAIAVEIDRERHPNVLVNELLPGIFKTAMSETGDDPMNVYPHARSLVSLPASGPHGVTFLGSEILVEDFGLKSRLRRALKKIFGRGA